MYVFLDNPGMWNLRSQHLKHWYLGQELYVRVHDDDPNPAKENPPPENLLLCGECVVLTLNLSVFLTHTKFEHGSTPF